MSRPEAVLNDIQKLNEQYWGQIAPLEKKLADLDSAYAAALRQGGSDAIARGMAAVYLAQLNELANRINGLYAEWERRLSFIKPPEPGPKPAGSFAAKVPWPAAVPPGVRKRLSRVIEQGGIPLSKRVQIIPARGPYGGTGVAVEFAKW